jgi:hypothetical protein
MKPTIYAPFMSVMALAACNSTYSPSGGGSQTPNHTTYSAQGDSTTIGNKLVEFRTALGGDLNLPNTPPAAGGRREINWDGVPPALTNVDNFPLDFFNVTSARGAVYLTPGTGIRIDSTSFATANAGLADQFKAFSGKKLFMAVGSNKVEVDFKLSGTANDGLVKGLGVVFSDVDRAGSARVDYLDANGVKIASLTAPAKEGAHEFSFIGAVFTSPVIAKVQIVSGNLPLTPTINDLSAGGTADLVVMDDFLYGEPQPVQ